MEHITTENIERELTELLDNAPMTCANLEKLVLLSRAMKYLGRVHREFTEEDAIGAVGGGDYKMGVYVWKSSLG